MPIENERKFMLRLSADLETSVAKVGRRDVILQGYVGAESRIRSSSLYGLTFTWKKTLDDGRVVEIETELSKDDFDLLWSTCTRTLSKVRYELAADDADWFVDFFKDGDDRTYFALAEAEMVDGMETPSDIHPLIRDHVVFVVPRGDKRFSSMRLCDIEHAKALIAALDG